MECASFPNNGPMMTPEPHMLPGYMGYVPQYKFKFGNTYGAQTNKLFLDPCINMSPRAVLTDICPEDCNTGGFLQHATGYHNGQCGCDDPYNCKKERLFAQGVNPGYQSRTPRFQTIMNHTYAPFCNRFCTKTFEQDQWRDHLFTREKQALDGWRFCYKTKPWEKPERTQPWDGDHAEFRRTQTTLLPPMMKADIDIGLRGCGCGPAEQPYAATSVSYNDSSSKSKRNKQSTCGPCDLYSRQIKGMEREAADAGLAGTVRHPVYMTPQGRIIQEEICERIPVLEKLNKQYMSRAPNHALEGVIEELGELPIITLHKLAQKREDSSKKFFPPERGLARVCNPVGSSYLTARPFRCNPIYRYCEPVNPTFAGHVPGEQFIPGENRGKATKNSTKYMTYRT